VETESEEDDSETDQEDEDNDNEWSGEPSRIETAVLSYVEDLNDAAWLIVELHKEYTKQEQQKIGGWQKGVVHCQGSSTSSNSQAYSGDGDAGGGSSHRGKKRRLSESRGKRSGDEGDEDNDGNDGDGPQALINSTPETNQQKPLFACPFHKLDPDMFCFNDLTEKRYRTCPTGQKTIQRLK
jgi:hypothetical protein